MNTTAAQWLERANILREALPYMRRYSGRSIVIKFGGHAMESQEGIDGFAEDIALLKQIGMNPIIVHGGGPMIKAMLSRLNIETKSVNGLRVTDDATMEVAEMVLGQVNKSLVAAFNRAGESAVGLSGKDAGLLRAEKFLPDGQDIGWVGQPAFVNPRILAAMESAGIIPVIAPIGFGVSGETYNINADTVAGAVASAIGATRLHMLTDVQGILDSNKTLIPELTPDQAEVLKAKGVISGGMIPKVDTCLNAVQQGVEGAVILDGRVRGSVLLDLLTDLGQGTLFRA